MQKPAAEVPRVGARERVARQALYGAGLLRVSGPADLAGVGLHGAGPGTSWVVLATEHPSLTPPELVARDLDGQPVLVLTWLEYDVMQGPLPEVAEITYGFPVEGPVHALVLRKVQQAADLSAPLRTAAGPGTPAHRLTFDAPSGPGVSYEPSYITRGAQGFFAQFGQGVPAGVQDPALIAAVRTTASGRDAREMRAIPLSGGGVRVELTLPIDAGSPIWGPRKAGHVVAFTSPAPSGYHEWLLAIE